MLNIRLVDGINHNLEWTWFVEHVTDLAEAGKVLHNFSHLDEVETLEEGWATFDEWQAIAEPHNLNGQRRSSFGEVIWQNQHILSYDS